MSNCNLVVYRAGSNAFSRLEMVPKFLRFRPCKVRPRRPLTLSVLAPVIRLDESHMRALGRATVLDSVYYRGDRASQRMLTDECRCSNRIRGGFHDPCFRS